MKSLSFINPTSKTFWTGVASIGYGVYLFTQGENGMDEIMLGLTAIFLRSAISNSNVTIPLVVLGSLFFAPMAFAQTPATFTQTPTRTPTHTRTSTHTPTITQTPSVTPTVTQTPDPDAEKRASHVTALELTIQHGDYDLPLYSPLCIASSYDPSDYNACRVVIYSKRVGGVLGLYVRSPDGTVKQITTIP